MLKLTPVFKDYLWGGTKLRTLYGKESDLEILAESWELSTHKDGQSIIAEGEHAGKTLAQYIKEEGKKALGTNCKTEEELPILIKFIDAKDNLSVQVHPEDEYAIRVEGDLGKTEMWYIMDCEEGAQLVYGFKEDITKEEFKNYIENNTLTEVLNYVDVKKGDVFFINPGTMHAIGRGIMIAEIQQSSNVTYRIYDYGRVGVDGKPRELHVDKALEVTNLEKSNEPKVSYELECKDGYKKGLLSTCEYFTVEVLEVEEKAKLCVEETSFNSILVLEGEIKISSETQVIDAKKGDSIFIPASYGEYVIEGKSKVILTTI